MNINILFNYRILAFFLSLFLAGSTAAFALERNVNDGDQASRTDRIMAVNEQIKRIALVETRAYLKGLKDDTCTDNITMLHNHFMDILAHYKPFQVTWDDYNPIKNFKLEPGNEEQETALLKAMRGTKNELKKILTQMKSNISNCTQAEYNFKNYEYTTYPVYTYSYPDYSNFYYPLLYGTSAWALWNGWNAWNGWGGYGRHGHHHHGHHRHHGRHEHHGDHHHGDHHHGHHRRGHHGHSGHHGHGHR